MSDADIFASGIGATFLFVGGVLMFLREWYFQRDRRRPKKRRETPARREEPAVPLAHPESQPSH